jgi:hypothetical protein
MKFLCGNCKAKYQLPDEKVVGRTLRMNCRQCKAPILIRGEGAMMSVPPAGMSIAAPAPLESMRAPMPGAARMSVNAPVAFGAPLTAPSALGAPRVSMGAPAPLESMRVSMGAPAPLGALRASVAAAPPIVAPPPLAAPPPLVAPALGDAWHVGIQDVPVGPMSRDEVARKIALGAVGADSLAWREGMGDWVAVRHIPELASLLGSRMPPPPEPALAPPLPMHSGRRSTDQVAFAGMSLSAAPAATAAWAQTAEPRASQVFPAAAGIESQVPPAPVAQGWGRMFAMAGGLAFLMTATTIVGVKYLRSGEAPPAAVPVAMPVPAPGAPPTPAVPVAPAPVAPRVADLQLDVAEVEAPAEPDTAAPAETAPAQKRAAGGAAKPQPAPRALSAAQKEMLARMGGGLDSDPALLNAPSLARGASASAAGSGPLTAGQLSAVVQRGRTSLQRCYETALRGVGGSQDTVRMDVEVTIAPSGNVTEAQATGTGLPGMDTCLERTVRMWRFPSSSESTQTKFPVVFQPGG